MERFEVEKSYEEEILQILNEAGFSDVRKMPYQSLYDFLAKKGNKYAYIEVKSRSKDAKTQSFTFPRNKIQRLKELKGNDFVFLLFINKYGHVLIELDDFLEGKGEIKGFKIYMQRSGGKYDYTAYSFNNNDKKWEWSEEGRQEIRRRSGDRASKRAIENIDRKTKDGMKHITMERETYYKLITLKGQLQASTWRELIKKIEKRLEECPKKKYDPVY